MKPPAEYDLRDMFAAAAVTGLLAAGAESPDFIAEQAYRVADAMLRWREYPSPKGKK